jgi:hypothetical protein
MSTKTLRASGVILGTFATDVPGDAGEALARATAIDARLAQHLAERDRVHRDPSLAPARKGDGTLDERARFAALQKLADAESARLADDALFLAKARLRTEGWRREMLEGSGGEGDELRRMELRRQFGALSEKARVNTLTKALDRRSTRDLGLLRALVADELTNEGLSGLLAPYREPIERMILELADPDGLAAWEKTNAQLDEFASAHATALRYVSSQSDPAHAEAMRGFVFLNDPPTA